MFEKPCIQIFILLTSYLKKITFTNLRKNPFYRQQIKNGIFIVKKKKKKNILLLDWYLSFSFRSPKGSFFQWINIKCDDFSGVLQYCSNYFLQIFQKLKSMIIYIKYIVIYYIQDNCTKYHFPYTYLKIIKHFLSFKKP